MRIRSFFITVMLLFLCSGIAAAEDIQKDRFQMIDNLVVDSETGLMWAVRDNGSDIDWWQAEKYCEEFTAGGYDDWRLPDIKELATLYTGKENRSNGEYYIAEPMQITECCIWSSYDVLGGALAFSFKSGKRIPVSFQESDQLRVLPVRGTSKVDLEQYKIF